MNRASAGMRRNFAVAAISLGSVLPIPAVARSMEATLVGHMLVQIPLLIVAGGLAALALPHRPPSWETRFNGNGACGLVLATLIVLYWMLPRALDAALVDPLTETAKFLTVPLAGAAIILSWRRMGFVGRSFVHLNAISMFAAEGWLYRVAPDRLCNAYLLDEQVSVGTGFLGLAGILAAAVFRKTLFAPFRGGGTDGITIPIVPVSLFGIILGVAGLGNCWRVAARLWGLPAWTGEAILALAGGIWAVLALLFILKWTFARAAAIAEARHPVTSCFVGLVFVTTLLTAVSVLPYSRPAAMTLAVVGWGGHIVFSGAVTGGLWRAERDPASLTAVLYLPTVAGNFVSAIAAGALGYPQFGMLFLGAGLISWLSIESVLMHQMYTMGPLAPAIRPTLGIQLAPPVVCCVAYLAVNGGVPDTFAQILFGYGLLQAAIMIRLVPWFASQPFVPGHWAFSFGVVALPLSALRMVQNGVEGPIAELAIPLFVTANLIIGYFLARTFWLLVTGRLLVPAAAKAHDAPGGMARADGIAS